MDWKLLNIPKTLMELRQWVCVEEMSKVPMQAIRKEAASSTAPGTWASFGEATRAVERGWYGNVGFVFNNNDIVGIDIDDGYQQDGSISETATHIIDLCHSYTEKSRSGRGFHIFLFGKLPFAGKNNLAGVEIYQTSRYFIMTGDMFSTIGEIREDQQAIDQVLSRYFPEVVRDCSNTKGFDRIYSPCWPKPEDGKIPLKPNYPAISQGGRNVSLTSLAGHLHTVGYNRDQIMSELLQANRTVCKPPLPLSEIHTIVRSVTRYRK